MKTPKLISESEFNRREKRNNIIFKVFLAICVVIWLWTLATLFMWG